MKHKKECIDCSRRQAERVFSLAIRDPEVRARIDGDLDRLQKDVGQRAIEIVENSEPDASPAEVSFWAILEAHKATHCDDPFLKDKRESNALGLSLYPQMKQKIEDAEDPLLMGCLLAASGNIIDLGIQEGFDLDAAIRQALTDGFRASHYPRLREEMEQTNRDQGALLYILDNAGETVFDRLLIEEILRLYPGIRIIASVNSGPILNDATVEDAKAVGLCDLVQVIENGHQDLGTVLSRCTQEFRDVYFGARLIIAKGQANYETLDERPENIFFILKAKCEVIARSLGVSLYDAALVRQSG
ncbi:MAG: ARMT1-like domain-containing protein [bacterium]